MDSSANQSATSPASPLPRPYATVALVVFGLYVAALYVLALDQQFHWGLFPSKVDRQLQAQVAELGDSKLSPEKRQVVMADIVSWNAFSIPVLLQAVEHTTGTERDGAAQCLQEISKKFYNEDISSDGSDPTKLEDWWIKLQAKWSKTEAGNK